jgi:hypothetical protein
VSTRAVSPSTSRDLRIDWLRGLAMTCVIVNHSKLQSVLSWFSYERFWVVTAAEVFVVLSGIVLGMVYGRRVARDGWRAVVQGLGRRALTLYLAFVAVTLSIVVLSIMGFDVWVLTSGTDLSTAWFTDPSSMDAAAWRDLLMMRSGVWAFEIVGLYVWLVLVAVPCLLTLHFIGWRPLLATSWLVYLAYRIAPHPLTSAEFEAVFPIAAWQLLFVHGIAIGYYRTHLAAAASRCPKAVLYAMGAAAAGFFLFAACNPWMVGPSWLQLSLISPDSFTNLYGRYFALTELGLGRIVNLTIGLPLGYLALTMCWSRLMALHTIFITLGQRSLGAFVLHTYALLLVAHIPSRENVWVNTVIQLLMIAAIAAILSGMQKATAVLRRPPMIGQRQPLGAAA